MSDIPEDHGYIKFIFSGVKDPGFIIETSFPEDIPTQECIDFMAQMLFYIHSGSLTEENASSVLETCTKRGHYELGAKIIQRWHQYETNEINNGSESIEQAPCVPPSSLFPKGLI